MIEIEIHSYCNRACPWCPNRCINRHFFEMLNGDIYEKLIRELEDNHFTGAISFSRNNEPFYKPDLLRKKIQYARKHLPESKIVTNTNGDYLRRVYDIDCMGIDDLSIMDYDCIGIEACTKRLEDIGAKVDYIDGNFIYAHSEETNIVYVADWPKHVQLEDKGGLLCFSRLTDYKIRSNKERAHECTEPYRFVAVDYNGKVTPCCQIRSDSPAHEHFVLGDLHDNTLTEIWTGEKAQEFRSTSLNDRTPCIWCHKPQGRYTRDIPDIHYSEQYKKGDKE
jgi:radical SAM protein with 4Fe4S-binding SPASM domain